MSEELNRAWTIVTNTLGGTQLMPLEHELNNAVEVLQEHGMGAVVEEWFYVRAQHHLRSEVAPKFWKNFEQPSNETDLTDIAEHLERIKKVFNELHIDLSAYWPRLERLQIVKQLVLNTVERTCKPWAGHENPRDYILLLLRAILFHNTNASFHEGINKFYFLAFRAYDASTRDAMDLDESEDDDVCAEDAELLRCDGCDQERVTCSCENILQAFHQLNSQLRDMGLLERLSGEAVTSLIHHRIKQHVDHKCKGNFEVQYIDSLEQWLETKVVGWLELIYGPCDSSGEMREHNNLVSAHHNPVSAHKDRLYHYMCDIYATTRIDELFNIIIEIPESEPALLDLKFCLEKTNLRTSLVKSLKKALETRLLHPGVNTADILTAYISAIRALRILDPTGVLLDLVCDPVRKYLRNRDDTVRCIVSSLTEDGNNELSDELVKGQPLMLDESYHSDDDQEDWETWQPDPVDADPSKSASSRRSSDIISMLVNIYGSKELFVNEYQTLLADRILTHFNYDTQKEIRYLELLKLRFGEAQLHYCEVMLKDVADSRRINMHIENKREKRQKLRNERNEQAEQKENEDDADGNDDDEQKVPLNAMILSAQFWPAFREEKLTLPEEMTTALEKYTKSYQALKGNRTLTWKPHLGLINLDIELKDKVLNLNVSPLHATILWHFQDKAVWTVEELSSVMQMPAHALRRRAAFWQSHGLLREEPPDTLILVEEVKGHSHDNQVVVEEDETESAMASVQQQKEEELQVVWQYVVGMLTNLESLPLERIHSMVKMFAMQGPGSQCTLQELKVYLDNKVKDQKLLFVSGLYRLPKGAS